VQLSGNCQVAPRSSELQCLYVQMESFGLLPDQVNVVTSLDSRDCVEWLYY